MRADGSPVARQPEWELNPDIDAVISERKLHSTQLHSTHSTHPPAHLDVSRLESGRKASSLERYARDVAETQRLKASNASLRKALNEKNAYPWGASPGARGPQGAPTPKRLEFVAEFVAGRETERLNGRPKLDDEVVQRKISSTMQILERYHAGNVP